MDIAFLIEKSRSAEMLRRDELVYLLGFPPDSAESYRVMAEAARVSKELSWGKAEVHAQFALNIGPCNCDCLFCSFAGCNDIFKTTSELTVEEAVHRAHEFEAQGANAIYVMSTAQYAFERFLETASEIRRNVKPETVLIANVGDISLKNAIRLNDTGFAGVYHALRLREGTDSGLSVSQRKTSIMHLKEAGLIVGTCVEPVGPEHSNEELAAMIEFTASFDPAFSGAARRIAIPGTVIASRGMITELRMAQIVAVTRLGVPRSVIGNCTHEPCTLGAVAGANLFWAESGANPRDITEKTEEGRGETIESCRQIFRESDWALYDGPSRYYATQTVAQQNV